MKTLLIHNVRLAAGGNPIRHGWLLVRGSRIADTGIGNISTDIAASADEIIDGDGAMLLPGAIDCHVHFREPGLTVKATIASESRTAAAGGVTSWIDMPNNVPPTVTIDAWHDKMQRADASSLTNYAFMLGATADNLPQLLAADYTRVAAIKVFMGSSTGGLLLDSDNALRAVFDNTDARIVVHAEDNDIINRNVSAAIARYGTAEAVPVAEHTAIRSAEACVRATEHAMELAARYGTRLHIAHISTQLETQLLTAGPVAGKQITAEVSPHHLLWCCDDYATAGTRIKMNPSVKTAADRHALRAALRTGRLDIVATDHAPHLLADKTGGALTAASGAPMVQFALPAVLDLMDPDIAVTRMCHAPADLYGIVDRGYLRPGAYADMVLVSRCAPYTVSDADVLSICGWTPMQRRTLGHRVLATWVNGAKVYDYNTGGIIDSHAGTAMPLKFNNNKNTSQ